MAILHGIFILLMTTSMTMATMTIVTDVATLVSALNDTATPPGACQTADGEWLDKWERKKVHINGTCNVCYCEGEAELTCVMHDCPVVFCDNPITLPGNCSCPYCPGGPWCTTYTRPYRQVEGLGKGEKKARGCDFCECDEQGRAVCGTIDCLPALCVDSERPSGVCCPRCPHGQNCRIKSTQEVIRMGERVEREGQVCECPQALTNGGDSSAQHSPQLLAYAQWRHTMTTAVCRPLPLKQPAISFVGDTV